MHVRIKKSGHCLVKGERGSFQCLGCGQVVARRQFKQWLGDTQCSGTSMPSSTHLDSNCYVGKATVAIGSKRSDPSHARSWKRGVWFCTACGAYAVASASIKSTCKRLATTCTKTACRHGRMVLSRVAAGRTLEDDMEWPSEECHSSAKPEGDSMEVLWPDRRGGPKGVKRKRRSSRGGESRASVASAVARLV